MNIFKKVIGIIKNALKKSGGAVFYAGASETLPKAYTADEERVKLSELALGLKGARDDLIEHNLRLVVYIARKFDNTGVDLDDLISIGTFGLIKAVNTFKGDKNIKLATYASRCIENEILMYLRKTAKLKSEVSFDEPLNTDGDGNELLLSDVLGSDPDVVYKKVENDAERKILRDALEKLSFREKQIMNLRFGLGGNDELTQKEVADLLGISQSYISRLEKKIVLRLKKEFKKFV